LDTHFAQAERLSDRDLARDIERVNSNPVIDGLLGIVNGLLAVLNEDRQIVALNQNLLDTLGVDNAGDVLGLRPGEAVGCVHSNDMAGGCGTSEFCSSCGAAIAIVTALATNEPEERKCAITAMRNGVSSDLFLRVRAQPIGPDGRRYLLLFLQDISREQEWSTLEKLFFHDINNIVGGLVGKSELLQVSPDKDEHARDILEWSLRLAREIEIQRSLFQTGMCSYVPAHDEVPLIRLVEELDHWFSAHTLSQGKLLVLPAEVPEVTLRTDMSLLVRIVGNMVTNALEAVSEGGEVRVSVTGNSTSVAVKVWNEGMIPLSVQRRMFQRNFSTKDGDGRGLGTYSMKLFGEGALGGRVGFTSSFDGGTEFSLTLAL